MKITKTATKKVLKADYIETLAYFAEYLAQFDEDEIAEKVEECDDKVWDWCMEWGDAYEERWLQVYSGLKISL